VFCCSGASAGVSGGKQSSETDGCGLSVVSICTPARPKPLSRLHPRLRPPDDGIQSVKVADSKSALTSFCTPSRAKSSLSMRQRDYAPHPHSTSLTLPHSYYVLGELFQSADTIISWLTNRAEICTFDKLKSAVQDMTKRYVLTSLVLALGTDILIIKFIPFSTHQ